MSLLMDALRKAEEAKRKHTHDPLAGGMTELQLEPLPTPAAPPPTAAPLSSPAQPAARPRSAPAAAAETRQQAAVQNMFSAKQTPARPSPLLLIAGAGLLGLAGIGAYVWWQLQPRAPQAPAPLAAAPMPAAQAVAPAAPPIAVPAELPLAAAPTPAAALPSHEKLVSPRLEPSPPPAALAAVPVRFSQSRPRVPSLVSQGYEALQQGNLAQAQQAYEQALAQDPKNLDTLYGLAAIALQRNQPALAEDYYLRVLETDPRDAVAHAGLSGLRGKAGANAESRLKTLIAEQPGVAALHFALGNLYAQDARWRDAQQAYFLAYKNDAENPDIAFNLAVSLDQLRQGRVAAQYYAEALRLAQQQRSSFNRNQAQQRLGELQAER